MKYNQQAALRTHLRYMVIVVVCYLPATLRYIGAGAKKKKKSCFNRDCGSTKEAKSKGADPKQ